MQWGLGGRNKTRLVGAGLALPRGTPRSAPYDRSKLGDLEEVQCH
jgi:hypothetical protein